MDTKGRTPRKGDRIQIKDFIGVFEVIEVRENGMHADLKHLSMPIWDHTETDLLSKEITYLNAPPSTDVSKPAVGAAEGPSKWVARILHSARKNVPVAQSQELGKAYS